jgi:hypothetical protein
MLADALVILVSLMLIAVAITQVLVPLSRNKPLFCSFRKSYQREKWLKQQLEETRRRLAELELEKQLADQQNELIRRQLEHMELYTGSDQRAVSREDPDLRRRNDVSDKER